MILDKYAPMSRPTHGQNHVICTPILQHKLNFEEAHARPLLVLKKTSLLKNELKNYRPVSKILEKVMANRLQAHKKHISNPLQSAYRKHLSTVSALLKVRNDIIVSMDKGEVTALALYDSSAVEYLLL